MNYTLKEIEERGMIIFSSIMGSKAYGTSLPTSDSDIRGIFIQPLEDILKYGYIDQISDDKNDIIFYELRRFMHLASNNNPNILELLNAPNDMIQIETPFSKELVNNSDKFLSKICKESFGGYAIQQIKKARGLNKKMNWEDDQITRKTVLDFCYVIYESGTLPLDTWILEKSGFSELSYNDFGLAKIDHAHDLYAMYRIYSGEAGGIVSDPEKSNDVQLSSIPKGRNPVGYLTFNKDAYSIHCKRYAEYIEWLEKRNEDRFKMNKDHGKNYDSKNLMHTFRLLNMAVEIAKDKKINVRRSEKEIETLMKIRRGEMEYNDLLNDAEGLLKEMDRQFDISNLSETPDMEFLIDLHYKIRMNYYLKKSMI